MITLIALIALITLIDMFTSIYSSMVNRLGLNNSLSHFWVRVTRLRYDFIRSKPLPVAEERQNTGYTRD